MENYRYDRQVRLWGDQGQNSISQASVCVLGSTSIATEILKNLVLAGIKSFHIIDDATVSQPDLGQNFFIRDSDIGKSRAAVVSQLLLVSKLILLILFLGVKSSRSRYLFKYEP